MIQLINLMGQQPPPAVQLPAPQGRWLLPLLGLHQMVRSAPFLLDSANGEGAGSATRVCVLMAAVGGPALDLAPEMHNGNADPSSCRPRCTGIVSQGLLPPVHSLASRLCSAAPSCAL